MGCITRSLIIGLVLAGSQASAATTFEQAQAQAALGSPAAQHALALRYALGDGVAQNYDEALRWDRLAAAQGYAASQYYLGAMYEYGIGVPADYREALRWYRFAAIQGHSGAQINLGTLYYEGKGTARDTQEALKWIRLAAAQGDPQALLTLGLFYKDGRVVVADQVQAHKWFSLAATRAPDSEGRDHAAQLRDEVAGHMTQAELAAARTLAQEWRPLAAQRYTAVVE